MAKKKIEKAAKKAITAAREAVDDAAKAVRKLDKKSKQRVRKLDAEAAALTKDAAKSAKRVDRASQRLEHAAAIATSAASLARESEEYTAARIAVAAAPVVPAEVDATESSTGAELHPDDDTEASVVAGAAAPSFRELREEAKQRSIPGYSRMNKAALLDALGRG